MTDFFGIIAAVAHNEIMKKQTVDLFVKVLVASMIFYDYVDPNGVFCNGSKINVILFFNLG